MKNNRPKQLLKKTIDFVSGYDRDSERAQLRELKEIEKALKEEDRVNGDIIN